MLFQFGARSSLLLPFVGPGVALTLFLLFRAIRTGSRPDWLLALLVAWPTVAVAQWMLGYAGWYDAHDAHSTVMFYVPWQLHLALGPLWYLYFRALTNQEFRFRPRAWLHLLPTALELAGFAGVALLDLGWRRGLHHETLPDFFGTKGAAATWRDQWFEPIKYLGYPLLLGYGLATLRAYRRYRRYLDDNFSQTERLRFAGLRQLLVLLLLVLVLSLAYSAAEEVAGGFSYDTSWYAFALRGLLIYALAVVGLQANYAAATSPLRFEATVIAAPEAEAGAEAGAAGTLAARGPAPPAAPTAAEAIALAAQRRADTAVDDEREALLLAPVPLELLAAHEAAVARAVPPAALVPELEPWRAKLLTLMEQEQPWLEPELTLTELAQRLRTNPGLLSRVINAGCGQNFNDFVNTYRVAEARRKLQDPRLAHYSLVGVALESGFNSKSTFNRVFKKLTGQVPGEVGRPNT